MSVYFTPLFKHKKTNQINTNKSSTNLIGMAYALVNLMEPISNYERRNQEDILIYGSEEK